MRSQLPEHALVTLLRQCFVKPRCQGSQARRLLRPTFRSPHISTSSAARCISGSIGQQRGLHTRNESSDHLRASFSSIEPSDAPQTLLYAKKHNSTKAPAPATTPAPPAPSQKHNSTTASTPAPSPSKDSPQFAILGGGITGLASAHYLTRMMPNANITIYEGSKELGGWVKSRTIETDEGSVVFEQGPRNIRPSTPAALVTLDMIQNLGIESSILYTAKDDPSALNRFVYYPDHLVKMPGPKQNVYAMVWSFLTESLFRGLLKGALFEGRRPPRSDKVEDESIGSFLGRRLGSFDPVNNIVSAVLHGIYAGDVYKLSARSLNASFWYQEQHFGSFFNALVENTKRGEVSMPLKDTTLQAELGPTINQTLKEHMKNSSVYTFKGGLGTLSQELEKSLRANPKVIFKMRHKISQVEYDESAETVKITAQNTPPRTYTHCISTLSANQLAATTPKLPTLKEIPYVTVMVVNLFFRDPFVVPEPGFGYLIPRSISFDQNPECALGVVFDSYSSVGQDTATGSKITVMLGGHWWDSYDSYPTEAEGEAMACAVLKRHLKIDATPERSHVTLQHDCIPQYTVGHWARLKKAHRELLDGFGGRLTVAGNWMDGVGLNDCARNAREAVVKLTSGGNDRPTMVTGLEDFENSRVFTQVKQIGPVRSQPKEGLA